MSKVKANVAFTPKHQRELDRRKKELTRIAPASYLVYMLVILTMVYIIDEIASNIGSSLQSEMVTEFFVKAKGLEYNTGLATYTAMTAPLYVCMVITPFYKSLADRFGRKLFLVLNTIGMGLGMLVCMMATGSVSYLCGVGLINFTMYNDMQVLYVMESAPEKHRAKLVSLTKAIALLGVSLIPLLRDIFMGNDGTQWQKVYFIPAVVGIGVGILAWFLMPETPTFIKKRIAFLEKLKANSEVSVATEVSVEANVPSEKENNGGVPQALKYIFTHRQTRAILLCSFLYISSTGVTSYYESIMKTGGMSTSEITNAMYFIPFVNAIMTALSGFIVDYMGRKKSCVLLSGTALVGLVAFILSSAYGLPPALVGISYGFFIGGLWSVADTLFILIPGESTPTHLRVSVVGTMGLISGVGTVLSIAIMTVGMLFVKSIGLLALCLNVPFLLASILVLIFKVRETKDVDLATVTGEEWE